MTRRRMPNERKAITHKFRIRGAEDTYKGYLTVGFFEDKTVGEIFVKMDKQGSQTSGFIDAFAIAVSMLLQTGTPLEDICRKFRNFSFEPAGQTDNPNIHFTRSPIDYIARYLEYKFVEVSTETTTVAMAEVVPKMACSKCGTTEGFIAVHFGRLMCDNCRTGKVLPESKL